MAHVVRRYIQSQNSSAKVLLKLDFKNAFNMIHRDKMLHAAREHIPSLYPFIWQCYRETTALTYGVQQGDPLGPLLFCLLAQNLISTLRSELNIWYLDDGTLGGPIDSVLENLETIKSSASSLGLHLNIDKCEFYPLGRCRQLWSK